MNILVIDDATDIRLILKTVLEAEGHQVTTATDGEEGWELLTQGEAFEVIISDWLMPKLNGPALCERIRAASFPSYIYIILLTGLSGKSSLISGIAAGADDFSTKPVNKEELIVRLHSAKRILDLEKSLAQQNEALELANNKLRIMATTDAMTGLFNRRTLQERLEESLSYAQRTNEKLSLLMIDVDYFKPFNDTYGHLKGDTALKTVAAILKKASRRTDIVARYGGEELSIILPNTDKTGAMQCAEVFRKSIENNLWPDRDITISIGATTIEYPQATKAMTKKIPAETPSKLLHEADQALYQAKENGRNTACHFVRDLEIA